MIQGGFLALVVQFAGREKTLDYVNRLHFSFRRRVFRLLSWLYGSRLRAASKQGFVLLYHRISDEEDWSYPPLPPQYFAQHCQELSEAFTVLPLEELVQRQRMGKTLSGCCSITFDDGYQDYLTNAYPILNTYKFPSTNFLVADSLCHGRLTWNARVLSSLYAARRRGATLNPQLIIKDWGGLPWEELERRVEELEAGYPTISAARALTSAEARGASKSMVSFGCHTSSHRNLRRLSAAEVELELSQSRTVLEQAIGDEIQFVAYPTGSYDNVTMEIAEKLGYAAGFAVGQRPLSQGDSLYAIPRLDVGTLWGQFLKLEICGILEKLRG